MAHTYIKYSTDILSGTPLSSLETVTFVGFLMILTGFAPGFMARLLFGLCFPMAVRSGMDMEKVDLKLTHICCFLTEGALCESGFCTF